MNLNRRKIFSAPVAVLAFASVPLPAFALFGGGGRIVYDPKNHVENIITAIKTTKMLIESIKTNMNGQTYAGTFANSAEMQEMLAVANATDAALKNSKKVMEDLNNVYGASPYENWDQTNKPKCFTTRPLLPTNRFGWPMRRTKKFKALPAIPADPLRRFSPRSMLWVS